MLRDMISTARLHPGGRVKIIELKALPPVTEPPMAVTVHTCTVMLHRFLITARELEIIYNLVSSDYLVSMEVTGSFATNGVVKNEITMQILKWTVTPHKSKKSYKMNTIDKPTVQAHGAVVFVPHAEYHNDVWLKVGREVYTKATTDDWALARDLDSIEDPALDEHVPDR